MGLFGRGPDTMELLRTLPISELRQSRKDWVRAWKRTRISAGHFVAERYGMRVTEDGEIVPTRGPAMLRPLSWDPATGYGAESARRLVRDVRAGLVPHADA